MNKTIREIRMSIALFLFVFILAACDPYEGLTIPTPTATATASQRYQLATIEPKPTPAPGVCVVSTGIDAGKLNIRTGAGVSFGVIGILHEGQALTVTDEPTRAGWLQVTAANVTGWINSNYCKMENKTSWKR